MGKKSGPPAPDYKGAAEQQAAASKELNTEQTWANRPNVSTPWGNFTWDSSAGVDPSTGQKITQWDMNVNLTPAEQAALNDQQAIQSGRSGAALGLLDQATEGFGKPMDWSQMPERAGNVGAFNFGGTDFRQKSQDAVMKLAQPMMDQRREGERSRLLNQGISEGSEAWSNAMRDVSDAENRMALSAIETGRGESAQQFGQDLSAYNTQYDAGNFANTNRAGAIAEEAQRRGMTLNELNALLTGQQVSMPNQPGFNSANKSEAPNYLGAAMGEYDASLDRHNAKSGMMGNLVNGAAQAASSYFMFSDERLKENIETVGVDSRGLRVVRYAYRGLPGRHVGVIAQEAAKVYPEAVALHPSGFLMVDYNRLGA
jgi:hypothetical protein